MNLNDETRQRLVETARQARGWAYAPYSQYAVGAALLTSSGRVYDGVNVENAAFPSTMCAERVAIFKAVSEGERDFVALAVVTSNAGYPCGGCRQVMAEFNCAMMVLIADSSGKIHTEMAVADLLPGAFLSEHLVKE